jgi:hypothetical protein
VGPEGNRNGADVHARVMSRIRFATVRARFEGFAEALRNIGAEPTDELPIAFLKRLLADGRPDHANAVCAYLLPRREAAWWGCESARTLHGDQSRSDGAGLVAAEAWLQELSSCKTRLIWLPAHRAAL